MTRAAVFHLATWIAVIVGSTLAVRAWQRGELAPPWRGAMARSGTQAGSQERAEAASLPR